jgi:two-component system NtrC family sensor kinase
MFKKCLNIIFSTGIQFVCLSQNGELTDSISSKYIDSLKQQLHFIKSDSARMMIVERIGYFYEHLNIDSSLHYFNEALNIAKQHSYPWAEARVLAGISGVMEHQGRYAEAFELLFESLKIAEESNSVYDIARANRRISGVYFELQNYPKAVAYLLKALQIDEANGYKDKVAIDHYALADAYEKINKLDSAAFHINISLKQKDLLKSLMQYVYEIDGHIKQKKGNYEQAALSYRKGFEEAQQSSDLISSAQICADFSVLYGKQNLKDSAIIYALKGFNYAKEVSYKKGIMLNGNLLAELYDSTKPSQALQYYKTAAAAKDSLYGVNSTQAVENLIAREEAKQKELEDAQTAYRNKLKLYGLLTGLAVLLVIAFILYRNNRQKQKANVLLQQQKEKIETTLYELKSTQAQLIQSEKMASLGELTAGIAHEIQNPLNFVNNFSEVNNELIEELKSQKSKLKTEEQDEILNDIFLNNEKINHHGKRADAIVKGMLQHSRSSSGQKEPTNINALADEYLRLAYHGLRAKDKTFNATMKTDFDETIGNINIIPQDIGRAILNLINNAFYVVDEKKKLIGDGYEPTVSVSTKKAKDKIEIKVKDNGNGIPQKVLDKIFQPFFTTKPTGQGTGLGLSLSYDIVKAHGGELKVETKDGEGSKFVIQLPV